MGMRESCDRAGFAVEPVAKVLVALERRREHFDGNNAIEAHVARPIDVTHPALADLRDDLIRTEMRADHHGLWRRPRSSMVRLEL